MKFELEQIITSDGVELEGMIAGSTRAKRALIFVHGLTSNFYGNVSRMSGIARVCESSNIVLYAFNNRGYEAINEVTPKNKKSFLAGGWFEKFTDCVPDIRAVIDLAYKRGAREIFLAGHSTGANKVVYYMAKTNDRRVKGVALVAAMSDVSAYKLELRGRFWKTLKTAQELFKKDKEAIFPPKLFGGRVFSAQRLVSLMTPGGVEDVFPYHGLGGTWALFQKIKKPMLVLVGSKDQYLDRPAEKYIAAFKAQSKSVNLQTKILAGARHSFTEHADKLGSALAGWVIKTK